MDLRNKTIIVTGAAQGIGQAIAVDLCQQGAQVALLDLSLAQLQETLTLCQQAGGQALALAADIRCEQQIETVIGQVRQSLGPLHGLINNAGILKDGLLVKTTGDGTTEKLPLSRWQQVIDTNLTGVFLCAREVAAHMIEDGSPGVIINISSISRAGNFGQSSYSAAKAAVVALTTTWARELARHGIRCAAIAPGMITSKMTDGMKAEARAKINAGIPLGEMGRPGHIAETVRFIFHNDYITGRVLEVDGGLRL